METPILRMFDKKDIHSINIADDQWELNYINKDAYGEYVETFSYTAETAVSGDIVLFIGAVVYSDRAKDGRTGEGVFIMSEEYTNNFKKYGIRTLKTIKEKMLRLDLDRIVATCYNSNKRGAKLIQLIGLKEIGKTEDFMGRPMRLFEIKLNNNED